ncbi:SDR family oxidoreductase [Rhodococcus sp. SBT000017]|uniref:SDR family NAD(P)-dependent oxidoreductase n=1 Tax=unclassified Rhodococcus (in: high G+C Gram-positive bacteria) TaxID=192944 RepID=UPI000EF88E3F|nr:SDR family oxidoreductase [Rhodococcus sp. SBT000017]RMB78912.1 SDR family oxidoreductase [Rhodococcus sp. SBT000017]
MSKTGRTALITGASAGIGAAFARHLAAEGHNLVLVARREDRLIALADELSSQHDVRCDVVPADLADRSAPRAILEKTKSLGVDVDILVNNAGMSGNSTFADAPFDALAAEIQVMITAVTELTHLTVPGMKERGYGRVVNLSSLAALLPPGASLLYTGIKSYVLDMSQALDMELRPHGIHVTALCPGFTHSEFHDVMGTRDAATSKLPSVLWQTPEDVVREGWRAVNNGTPVCVPGMVNKVTAAAAKPIPTRIGYYLGKTLNPFKL